MDNLLTGNVGEWSETYVLLRILETGRLVAADKNLNAIKGKYYPVFRICRNEREEGLPITNRLVFDLTEITDSVVAYRNGSKLVVIDRKEFGKEADYLYSVLKSDFKDSNSFPVPRTQKFMESIGCKLLKPTGQDKADIRLCLHDVNTSYELECDFSVKSNLGAMPTLLNASEATNFIYEVSGVSAEHARHFNSIEGREKINDRLAYLKGINADTMFVGLNETHRGGRTFENNLRFIDERMPEMLGWLVKLSYERNVKDCNALVNLLDRCNPLGYPLELRGRLYGYKIRKFLLCVATSMIPTKAWDGRESANGGYIIVRKDGAVLTYYLYNRDEFEDYLLDNTALERASSSRHKYGVIYEDGKRMLLNLNLQIRFKS